MLVNVTIPVFNEAVRLPRGLPVLHRFLVERCRFDFEVVIADNGSTDRTPEIAHELVREYRGVRLLRLDEKGRGRALKEAWGEGAGTAEVLTYMDVDLSTDLEAFPRLVEAVQSGGFDLAIGSRLTAGSRTTRGWKRELTSRCYNRLIRMICGTRFADAQCGFKAMTRRAAIELLPRVEDDGWFFDTELLVLAGRLGYRVFELPVRWVDDPDTRVRIWATALGDIRGLIRMRRTLPREPMHQKEAKGRAT
jgi:glycosyltransferase involved in cell wall biosynthesis